MQAAMHLDAHAGEHELYPELEKACVSLKATAITMDLS